MLARTIEGLTNHMDDAMPSASEIAGACYTDWLPRQGPHDTQKKDNTGIRNFNP